MFENRWSKTRRTVDSGDQGWGTTAVGTVRLWCSLSQLPQGKGRAHPGKATGPSQGQHKETNWDDDLLMHTRSLTASCLWTCRRRTWRKLRQVQGQNANFKQQEVWIHDAVLLRRQYGCITKYQKHYYLHQLNISQPIILSVKTHKTLLGSRNT